MATSFNLYVSYQQITVFDASLDEPFNYWEDQHVAQGFSWRDGSVAFGTFDADGTASIEVCTASEPVVSDGVIRALVVPFESPRDGQIEVATITESQLVTAPCGTVGILFEAGIEGDRSRYRITFLTGDRPSPQILVADDELTSPEGDFLMETVPG